MRVVTIGDWSLSGDAGAAVDASSPAPVIVPPPRSRGFAPGPSQVLEPPPVESSPGFFSTTPGILALGVGAFLAYRYLVK